MKLKLCVNIKKIYIYLVGIALIYNEKIVINHIVKVWLNLSQKLKKQLGIKSKYYLITIKLKHCGILLKLKCTGMVRWTIFFVSAEAMTKVMTIKIDQFL